MNPPVQLIGVEGLPEVQPGDDLGKLIAENASFERGDVLANQKELAEALYTRIPAGVGSTGAIRLGGQDMDAMLAGGAKWAVERGWGEREDLDRGA